MPLPAQNLDDKTFSELFEESRALIPRYAKEWIDHNVSDPGITFIDLFAWLAEMQIYFLNRVTDRNFLKFIKLLGDTLRPAIPARAEVMFEPLQTNADPVSIPRGTKIAATDPMTAERIIFETEEDLLAHFSTLRRILTRSGQQWIDNTASNATIGVFYLAFGADPGQGDRLYLGFDAERAFPTGEIRLTVSTAGGEAGVDGAPALIPSAELKWHYWSADHKWKQLQVTDGTVALTRSGVIGFRGPADIVEGTIQEIEENVQSVSSGALYWLRASIGKAGYELPPRLDTISVNTVSATQGKRVRDEYAAGNGLLFQKIKLRNKPVLSGTVKLMIQEKDGQWHEWTEVADFDASGPESRHFTVNLQDGLIKFGDGIRGQIPPAPGPDQNNIRIVEYRAGGGAKGNVRADQITEVLSPDLRNMVTVTNRRPATGGMEPEPLSDAKSRVRRNFKEITRGITTADFETLALNAPGIRVARVKVLPQYHPTVPAIDIPGALTVVAVPENNSGETSRLPAPSQGFLQNLYEHLISKSLISTNLSVIGPEFIEVKVTAKIRVDSRMSLETVRGNVLEALRVFLDPLTGGANGMGWPFGRPVYRSEIYQIIERITGVTCVDQVSLSGKSCDSALQDRITLRKIGLVYSGQHEIAVC
jgi:predicted phage baseplate assembly protein